MPSPFPGMNPYLEQPGMWRDFHGGIIQKVRAQLVRQLSGNYFVRLIETVYLKDPEFDGFPDAEPRAIILAPSNGYAAASKGTSQRVDFGPEMEKVRQFHIEVCGKDAYRTLLTAIEIPTPVVKTGPDRALYLHRRRAFVAARVNVVEIDLQRAGGSLVPGTAAADYTVLTYSALDHPFGDVRRFHMADPFPEVRVPLASGEEEPTIDMKAALDSLYDDAGYETHIYESEPVPPLTPEQAVWASLFVPSRPAP